MTDAEDLIDNLQSVDLSLLKNTRDWNNTYRLLIRWGALITKKNAIRTDANSVSGCESKVWLDCLQRNGKIYYRCDSDSKIIKGLAAIIFSQLNGSSTEQIAQCCFSSMLEDLGLHNRLSESRSNGFNLMLNRAIELAENYAC